MPQQTQEGAQKQTTHDFLSIRDDIGIHNANVPQIASALVSDHQLRDSHRIHPKADVNRERSYLKRALDHLQTSHEWRGEEGVNIMAENRGLLDIINDEKKVSKGYTDDILLDAEKVYSDAFVLMEEAKEKKR